MRLLRERFQDYYKIIARTVSGLLQDYYENGFRIIIEIITRLL